MSSNFFPSTKVIVSTAASVAATTMLIRSFAKDFIPGELRQYLYTKLRQFLTTFSDEITFMIDEFDGLNKNQLFYAAELYVATIISPSTKTLRASLPKKEKKIHVSLGKHEEIKDNFCGIQLKWRTVTMSKQTQSHFFPYRQTHHSTMMSEVRYLELTFHKKHKNKIVDEYLPYVLAKSEGIKQERKTLKLHSLQNGGRGHWQSVNLDHPANFNTLAMDDEIKNLIIDDLERFLKRKEFYRKIGKAWKRGYLLFGPPGTGKSSLIAAMANYLHFDVYDLELTDLRCNSDWRRLLISTANRSILVVEDIDVSIDLSDRSQEAKKPPPFQHNQGAKVTLSGLLNFMDGLWSSCGDERIIIFTTNHKDKLDPALLRPGRMDMHIHMSYCTPSAFKMLASNYLGTTEHPLVLKAEELIASSKVTPAEVAEQLLKGDDHEVALQGLIKFLEHKTEAERDGDGNREEMEKVMPNRKSNASKSIDRLKELIESAKPSLADMSENIPEGDEAANALKILIEFLQGEIGTGNTKDCDEVFASSEAAVLESGKENGIKSE